MVILPLLAIEWPALTSKVEKYLVQAQGRTSTQGQRP